MEIKEISESDLPEGWKEFPHPVATQKFGNDFVSQKQFCVLKIPSVVTQGDFNYLIDPNHKDFNKIKVTKKEKFPYDNRIFQ
jgi:RES domain-containing protein